MFRLSLMFMIILSAGLAQAFTGEEKISPFLKKQMQHLHKTSDISALIILKEKATLSELNTFKDRQQRARYIYQQLTQAALKSQKNLIEWLTNQNIRYRAFYIDNVIAIFKVNNDIIKALAARDDIARLITNESFKALPEVYLTPGKFDDDDPAPQVQGNLAAVGADKVWQEFKTMGEGIVVAGQDTGVEWTHPALKPHYRGWNGEAADHNYNWHDAIHAPLTGQKANPCGYDSSIPCDDHDHGTHTLGTVVGDDLADNRIGVAPRATWIACRNMDSGVGTPSTYIECFEWFFAPYPYQGDPMKDGDPSLAPDVINNSWGCPPSEGCKEAEILPILERLQEAGIMVVASAGNDGPGCGTINAPPAMHSSQTLSVGAYSHSSGEIASFSSRGPSLFDQGIGPDVVAPGVNIRSSVRGGRYSSFFWSGTSMAGPHVVGAVALIWSAVPQLKNQITDTVNLIRQTATPTTSTETCGDVSGDQIPNNTYGFGKLDVYKAIEKVQSETQP